MKIKKKGEDSNRADHPDYDYPSDDSNENDDVFNYDNYDDNDDDEEFGYGK
jgi:hypothetical protein